MLARVPSQTVLRQWLTTRPVTTTSRANLEFSLRFGITSCCMQHCGDNKTVNRILLLLFFFVIPSLLYILFEMNEFTQSDSLLNTLYERK